MSKYWNIDTRFTEMRKTLRLPSEALPHCILTSLPQIPPVGRDFACPPKTLYELMEEERLVDIDNGKTNGVE